VNEEMIFMLDENIQQFLEKMIEAENSIVQSVTDSVDAIENLAVKSALKGISLDSMKHADMYLSAIALLDKRRPPVDQEQFDKQRDLVSRHILMEEKVIEKIEEMMPKLKNEKISFLLRAILTDEKRHHKLLKKLHEFLVRGETITDEDWWDSIWKDVPGLWT